MAVDLIKKVKEIDKDFYTIPDLEKISQLDRKSLLVALARLQKRGRILRLFKGIYQLPDKLLNLEKIANQIYQPSYISFESALSKHGIINQIPYTITYATTNKPKTITFAGRSIVYRRLKPELFFGFSLENGTYLAEPEKALLDQLYLVSKGKASLSLEELNMKNLDKKKFYRYAQSYPKPTQKLTKLLIDRKNEV